MRLESSPVGRHFLPEHFQCRISQPPIFGPGGRLGQHGYGAGLDGGLPVAGVAVGQRGQRCGLVVCQ